MAMGLSIFLVAPQGEASNLLSQLNCGVWIEAGDLIAFKAEILNLYQDLNKLQIMKQQALSVVGQFSRENQAKKFLVVLNSILEKI